MARVKQHRVVRLLIACTVDQAVSIREDWTRSMFQRLQDEFPRLLGTPLIVPDQAAAFLRPAEEGGRPAQLCEIRGNNLVVVAETPSSGDMQVLPGFALRLFDLARDTYHVERVARVGRVEVAAWTLDADGDAAPEVIRTGLTKLEPEEAADVELQFTKHEDMYNINLRLSTNLSSGEPGPTGPPKRDILLTQSDVNNWDVQGDVTRGVAEDILARGAKHAREEVPAFLRDRLSLQIDEG